MVFARAQWWYEVIKNRHGINYAIIKLKKITSKNKYNVR